MLDILMFALIGIAFAAAMSYVPICTVLTRRRPGDTG